MGGFIRGWGTGQDNGCAACNNCTACGINACLPTDGGYVAVAAGWDHGFALHSNGSLRVWTCSQENLNPDKGLYGTLITDPYWAATGMRPVYTAIAAGEWFNLALRSDGTIWAWGNDLNMGTISQIPNNVPGMYKAIAAGGHHGIALRSDGKIATWGGTGYTSNTCSTSPHPGTVPALLQNEHFLAVGGGHVWSYGILADEARTIVGWGCHCATAGQFVGTPQNGYYILGTNGAAVTGGYLHGAALTVDGHLLAWGQTGFACNTGPSFPNEVPQAYQALHVLLLGQNNVGKHNVFIYDPPNS